MGKTRNQPKSEPLVLTILVSPRSSRISIEQKDRSTLRVKLTAPPVDDAANRQLIEVLSDYYSVAKRDVRIISGQTSRTKRVTISRT